MTREVIRLGDPDDHGCVVITSARHTYVLRILVARLTDLHSCPLPGHGVNPIVTGSPHVYVEGRQIARRADVGACGAGMIPTQSVVWSV